MVFINYAFLCLCAMVCFELLFMILTLFVKCQASMMLQKYAINVIRQVTYLRIVKNIPIVTEMVDSRATLGNSAHEMDREAMEEDDIHEIDEEEREIN